MISKKFRIVTGYAAVDGSIFKAQPDVEAVSHDADHPAFVDPQLVRDRPECIYTGRAWQYG
ncbi:Uncharacterised protein [Corynebacterium striatum]|nr:Uncharacterised protein [Corynebacterium striatum]